MRKLMSSILALSFLIGACGPTKNNPIEKYNKQGLVPANSPDAANGQPRIEYRHVDKEVVVTKEVPVEVIRYVNREVEQTLAQGQVFQVDAVGAARFVEGKANAFTFKVRILQGKVKFGVSVANIPEGARLQVIKEETNLGEYRLEWAPRSGLIPRTQNEMEGEFQIQLSNLQFVDEKAETNTAVKRVFDVIAKTKSINYIVRRSNEKPSFTITGLANNENRKEGEVHPFSIEVKAPGTSNGQAPEIVLSYDPGIPGNNPVVNNNIETPGAYYIRPTNVGQFLGEDKWKFTFNFDTLNHRIIQMQMNGAEASSQQVKVQVTFQVNNSFNGTTSDKKTIKFAINLKPRTTTPAVTAGATP
ncbi:MAG: hypothetical protein K2Q26_06825 [Bdellovibrionales bacterium]|nr:hypothetical protein [Bdellovibrionales bacterium]